MEKFFDRREAGQILAEDLKNYAKKSDVIILALPRGGVPVAYEIAKRLSLPLDVLIVRKLGVPGQEELAMGAIATGGVIIFNDDIVRDIHLSQAVIDHVIESEKQELERRTTAYRGNKPFPVLNNKTIILVDDGIATGATMRAAIAAVRQQKPARIVMAVPVAAQSTYQEMKTLVDKIVCPLQPEYFYAVGAWYEHFSQTTDEEVFQLLLDANQPIKDSKK